MLSSISPLGERARSSRWSVTVTAYTLGSVLGGVALGTLSAGLGALVPATARASAPALTVCALLLVLGLLAESGVVPGGLPSWRRQVDEGWLTRYRGWVYGLGFGAQLGLGVVTIVPSTTTYAVALAAGLTGHLGAGAAIGGVFGLVRAVPVTMLSRVTDPGALHATFRRVQAWAAPADRIARAGLVLAALTLVAAPLLR